MDEDEFVYAVIGFAVGVALAFGITFYAEQASWRKDAVSKGVAEYYLDKDNTAQWRWIADRPKPDGVPKTVEKP